MFGCVVTVGKKKYVRRLVKEYLRLVNLDKIKKDC